jgi:peptide/nickel transport system substrate-binding protein
MKIDQMNRREFLQVASVIGLGATTAGYSLVTNAAGEKVLNARTDLALVSLDPGYMVGGSEVTMQWAMMPRLANFSFDSEGALTWVPSDYVTRLEHTDPTHIAFTVKPGLMWSNGFGEFTAQDVKYSLERMLVSEWKGQWSALDSVELDDKYSGTIILNKPFAPIWAITIAAGTGCLVCKEATEKAGGQYAMDIPATCGPYVMDWVPKQKVTLTPNPEWTGPKPYFDKVVYNIISSPEAAELAFEAGEIDSTKITAKTMVRWEKEPPENSSLHVAGALQYMWMGMNTDHPKLQDIKVRQALQHAIDVDTVLEGAYEGASVRSYGMVCPGLVGNRQSNGIDYNPAKAKSLLSEAGVSGLSLVLKTLNHPERVLAAQIIQANLADVGVSLEVIPLDSGPFWSMGQESKGDEWKESQLWLMRFGGSPDPHDMAQWFIRDQVGIWNWERWSDDEFEALYEAGQLETDLGKRNDIYVRMQEIMDATGAYVWIGHEPEVFAHRNTVKPYISAAGEEDFARFSG